MATLPPTVTLPPKSLESLVPSSVTRPAASSPLLWPSPLSSQTFTYLLPPNVWMEPPNGNLLTSPLTRQQIDNARRTDTISSHFYNSRDYGVLDAEPLSADICHSQLRERSSVFRSGDYGTKASKGLCWNNIAVSSRECSRVIAVLLTTRQWVSRQYAMNTIYLFILEISNQFMK